MSSLADVIYKNLGQLGKKKSSQFILFRSFFILIKVYA